MEANRLWQGCNTQSAESHNFCGAGSQQSDRQREKRLRHLWLRRSPGIRIAYYLVIQLQNCRPHPRRDPTKRPTARDALTHPWLRGSIADRGTGKPLDQTVVQRLQVTAFHC